MAAQLHTPEDCVAIVSYEGGNWATSRIQQIGFDEDEEMGEGLSTAAKEATMSELRVSNLSREATTGTTDTGATATCVQPAEHQTMRSKMRQIHLGWTSL